MSLDVEGDGSWAMFSTEEAETRNNPMQEHDDQELSNVGKHERVGYVIDIRVDKDLNAYYSTSLWT